MDHRLIEAARTGNTVTLHQLLEENPFILADVALMPPHENPLNVATKAGQLLFVREILRLKPELAVEPNRDGFRAMDIASAYGYIDIVRELLEISGGSHEICRLPGRDGRTALHYAAINGRVEIMDILLTACGEAIKEVTSFGETALHLAVKFHRLDALTSLVQWLERLGLQHLVNGADKEGNTILHLAVSRKQYETIELLLGSSNTISGILEVNCVNGRGLAAMDVLDMVIESSSDVQIGEMLRRAGGHRATDTSPSPRPSTTTHQQVATSNRTDPEHLLDQKPMKWFDYFSFQWQRDSPSEARNALLVVAALIATVTFQAALNPSPFFLEDQRRGTSNTTTDSSLLVSFTVFLFANSLGFAASVNMIDYLTVGLPFQRELRVAVLSIMFAYGWSLGNTKPSSRAKDILLGVALCLPFFLRFLPELVNTVWKWCRKNSTDQPALEAAR